MCLKRGLRFLWSDLCKGHVSDLELQNKQLKSRVCELILKNKRAEEARSTQERLVGFLKSQNYIKEDYRYVVDIDLEKFFERVGHDRLMSKENKRITGKRVLRLMHKLLKASVMDNGIFERSNEGTP